MRNMKCVFRRKHLFRIISMLLLLAATPLVFGSEIPTLWEGSAAIGAYGILPVRGLYGASNSFPRNTMVVIENLENGNSTEIFIVDRLENSSFLVLLSQEAGEALGIGATGVIRVRGTLGAEDKTDNYALNNDQIYSSDPDINPAAAAEISAAELGDTDEILAASVFPVDEPVAPLESEAAQAAEALEPEEAVEVVEADEPEVVEDEPEPLTDPVVDPVAVEDAESDTESDTETEVVTEPIAEPEIVSSEEPAKEEEPIEIEEPEAVLAEKEPAPADPKKDPVVEVAGETVAVVVEDIEPEAEDEIGVETLPEPEVVLEEEDEDEVEPVLEPVEYEPAAEAVLTYISENLTAPGDEGSGEEIPSVSLPDFTFRSQPEEEVESISVSSYPLTRPDVEFTEALFTTVLPVEPEIAPGPDAASDIADEIPSVEAPAYVSVAAEDPIPAPVAPVVVEYRAANGIAAEAEPASEEIALLNVESGYLVPAAESTGIAATHLPSEPDAAEKETALAMAAEIPVPVNGYASPGLGQAVLFGEPALPSDPSAVSVAGTDIEEDILVGAVSGLIVPGFVDAERFGLVALPEDPSAEIEIAEAEDEVPGVVNGFVSPESETMGRISEVDTPVPPDEPYRPGPWAVNGYMDPSGVEGEAFASAVPPEEPEEPEEDKPELVEGYEPPAGEDSGELIASVVLPEEPAESEEDIPSTVEGYVPPVVEEPGELIASAEPVVMEAEPEAEPEDEKIEIEVPVYEGDVELVLEPAEDRPPEPGPEIVPEVVEIPEVVEGEPAATSEEGDDVETVEVAEAEIPEEPETLPSLSEILAGEPDVDTEVEEPADIEEPGDIEEPADVEELEIEIAEKPEEDLPSEVSEAPVVKTLEGGYHYIQVGVYGDQVGASRAVDSIKGWSPVPVVVWTPESAEHRFKVMVGPLTPDESGVMLYNLKGKGYRDAFLRKVMEPNG